MRPIRSNPSRIVGLLDIGTSKIACLIVALEPRGPAILAGMDTPFRVLGIGHQRSRGLKAGVITDLDEAEVAVRAAVDQAEHMSGVRLDEVYVSLACGRLKSEVFAANADVANGVVGDGDIARVLDGGRAYAERDGRMLVHMNRVGLRLDGAPGGADPRGLAARRITADLHAVTADDAPVRNVMLLVDRCYLGVAGVIATPHASALAASSVEERRLGVTVIDIGGGVTTIALFADNRFIHAEAIPVGGGHMTFDIARGLQTPLADAERIKALYGSLVLAPSDLHEGFSYPMAGDADGIEGQTTRAVLADILRPRMSSLLGLVQERLQRSGMAPYAGDRVVLTGGSSQLVGIGEHVANVLGRRVRVSGPDAASGVPGGLVNPSFATVVGMVAAVAGEGLVTADPGRSMAAQGYIGRVGQWLKQGLQ
ncbi:MAG: cell division protein FtsA [Hyphomicrobiaceae bacterium]|nr:cell division protein FtsA [Hyphomicrobiaceae bacterium]